MNPICLRRFGAALVCSLALATLEPDVVLATNADGVAKTGDANPDAAKPNATKPDATKPDAEKPDAAKPEGTKPDAAESGEAGPDAAKAAGGGSAKPGAMNARADAGEKNKLSPAQAAAKAKAEAEVPKSTLEAREEAEREGRRHGARSKAADGTLLVWDNVNSVWVALEPKDTYWVKDRFYRNDEGVWLSSRLAKGPWEVTPSRLVPEAPRDRHGPPKKEVTVKLPSGVDAVYDSATKAYKIGGRKGVFLVEGVFWRWDGGLWLESTSPDGPWKPGRSATLPQTLRRALPAAAAGARVTLPGGEVLVSEGQPNLFAVEGKPDVLFYDGTYYERRDQKWFHSQALESGWEEVTSQKIPGMVRSNYHAKKKKGAGKDKGAGNGKVAGRNKGAAKDKGAGKDKLAAKDKIAAKDKVAGKDKGAGKDKESAKKKDAPAAKKAAADEDAQ